MIRQVTFGFLISMMSSCTVYLNNEFVIEYTESQFANYFRSKKQITHVAKRR